MADRTAELYSTRIYLYLIISEYIILKFLMKLIEIFDSYAEFPG